MMAAMAELKIDGTVKTVGGTDLECCGRVQHGDHQRRFGDLLARSRT